ncbi:hypothetical protein NEUTE2DRAFT_155032, partial [Neurospora tetrasperma FGSC 2509]
DINRPHHLHSPLHQGHSWARTHRPRQLFFLLLHPVFWRISQYHSCCSYPFHHPPQSSPATYPRTGTQTRTSLAEAKCAESTAYAEEIGNSSY